MTRDRTLKETTITGQSEVSALRLSDVSVNFGNYRAVSDFTFDLPIGYLLVILGVNGAGKSSLLRCINCTVPISGGSITIFGKDVASLSRRELATNVAVVAQENETKFPITVFQYVLSGRYSHSFGFGPDSSEDIAAVQNAIALCNLSGYDNRLMNELSGGERQRAVLARAIATQARILLLDEPSANLDPGNQSMIFKLVSSRCKECGGSAVIVTHDLNLASYFADTVLLMERGRLIDIGEPTKVLTSDNLRKTYGIEASVEIDSQKMRPRITILY